MEASKQFYLATVISTMPQENGYYCQSIYEPIWLVREYVEIMRCKKLGCEVYTSLACLACQNLSRQCGHAQPGIWSIALQYLINKDQTLSEGAINPQSVMLTTTYDKELQWESLKIICSNHDYSELWTVATNYVCMIPVTQTGDLQKCVYLACILWLSIVYL